MPFSGCGSVVRALHNALDVEFHFTAKGVAVMPDIKRHAPLMLRAGRADGQSSKGSAVTEGRVPDDGGKPSAWAPLRSRVYRDLFIAQFVSNIGTWMQTVAAQWFLVEAHSSATIVALVQTASLGPTLLLGLLAG